MTTRIQSYLFTYWCVSFAISAASVFAVLAATAVQAAEWRIEPLISVAGDFDDNAILTHRTDAQADISGYIIEARVEFAYTSETTGISMTPRLRSRDYGDPRFDTDDQFLRFSFDHDTQSTNFGLRADYTREGVRTAERADVDLEIEEPDEIPDDDTGRVGIGGRREKIQVAPSWTYSMSDVSSIGLSLRYTDVWYDESLVDLFTDYTDARANVSYRRSWSPRNTAILTGTYRQYEADPGKELAGAGISAGFERRISETTRFRAVVGLEETDQETGESESSWDADISLTRRLQTITMLAQYRRGVAAGGGGSLSIRDSLNLNFKRRLTERISAGLGVRAYRTDAANDANVTFNARDYVQLRSQLTWHLSPTWSLETNYRYTFLKRNEIGESANSNNVTIWLNYRPTPIIRSR